MIALSLTSSLQEREFNQRFTVLALSVGKKTRVKALA
jgi:hypothetical protein